MLGGVLFPLLLVVNAALFQAPGTGGTQAVTGVVLVSFVLFVPGVVGIHLAHRASSGPFQLLAVATLTAGLALNVVVGLLEIVAVTLPSGGLIEALSVILLVVGAIGVGAVIARADVLVHARSGGALLAGAFPLSVLSNAALDALNLGGPLANAVLVSVPFGVAWFVLGLVLLTFPDSEATGADPG
jgi:hypothetical protein